MPLEPIEPQLAFTPTLIPRDPVNDTPTQTLRIYPFRPAVSAREIVASDVKAGMWITTGYGRAYCVQSVEVASPHGIDILVHLHAASPLRYFPDTRMYQVLLTESDAAAFEALCRAKSTVTGDPADGCPSGEIGCSHCEPPALAQTLKGRCSVCLNVVDLIEKCPRTRQARFVCSGCCSCAQCSDCKQHFLPSVYCRTCSRLVQEEWRHWTLEGRPCRGGDAQFCDCVRCETCGRAVRADEQDVCACRCDAHGRCISCCGHYVCSHHGCSGTPATSCAECPQPWSYVQRETPHFWSAKSLERNQSKRFLSLEIECFDPAYNSDDSGDGRELMAALDKWRAALMSDGSVDGGQSMEVCTAPAGGDAFVEQVHEFMAALDSVGARTNKSCGMHVHVDARNLGWYDIRKLVMLWEHLEPVIYSLVPLSRRVNWAFCRPAGRDLLAGLPAPKRPAEMQRTIQANVYTLKNSDGERSWNSAEQRRNKYCPVRYRALNLHSWYYRGTVENRLYGGTLKAADAINWGRLNAHLVDYAQDTRLAVLRKSLPETREHPATTLKAIVPKDVYSWAKRRAAKLNPQNVAANPWLTRTDMDRIYRDYARAIDNNDVY